MISIVVAMNQDNVIGVNNQLPWHISEDLQHFKAVTLGKPIIMGRKTFESIGRVLPQRKNIVITRTPDWHFAGVNVYKSLEAALDDNQGAAEICIIGGGEMYKLALPFTDKLYLTMVDLKIENLGAVFFPEIDYTKWKLTSTQKIVSKQGINCVFNEYLRQK